MRRAHAFWDAADTVSANLLDDNGATLDHCHKVFPQFLTTGAEFGDNDGYVEVRPPYTVLR